MGADRAKRKVRGGSVLGMDWEDKTREKIQKSRLANQLISYVLGEVMLEPAQVTAGLGLLKKVLPDLSTMTLEGGKRAIQLETLARTIVDPNPDG